MKWLWSQQMLRGRAACLASSTEQAVTRPLRTIASAPAWSITRPSARPARQRSPRIAGIRPSRPRGPRAGRGAPAATTSTPRTDRIGEPLARRVDAAERDLHAAADERVGELADEALDAAGQRQALAEQQDVGRAHRRLAALIGGGRRRSRSATSIRW